MKKQFFKAYIAVRDSLENDKNQQYYHAYSDDNYACLAALEKYLYSYHWCRSARERLLLQNAASFKTPETIAKENGIPYNSYRSMSSRVSQRMYLELGGDFDSVILGGNKKAQEKLVNICIGRTEVFDVHDVYPDFLLSKLDAVAKEHPVEIEDDFKLDSSKAIVIKFLADNSENAILKRLSLLDEETLIKLYRILTEKKYFSLRVEALGYMKELNNRDNLTMMQKNVDICFGKKVPISKQEYEEFQKYKKGGI